MQPQLAYRTRERFSSPGWVFERKLSGERCPAFAWPDGERLMSLSKRDITSTFPETAPPPGAQRPGGLLADDPQRSRVGFGALLLGYHDNDGGLAYAGRVGTGFDNRTLRSLHATLVHLEQDHSPFSRGRIPGLRGVHWVQPRLVGQVAFTEWTTDGQLRHPQFQGLRDDKDPGDVVRELPS